MARRLEHLRPSTRPGRAAAVCLGGFVAAFVVMNVAAMSGQTGGDRLSDSWWLAGPALLAAGFALAGLIFVGYAVVRRGERSLPVWLVVAVGAVAAVFIGGEVFAPH